MNNFAGVARDTLKHYVAWVFRRRVNWDLVLHHSQRNALVIIGLNLVGKGGFAKLTFKVFPIESLNSGGFLGNFAAIKPFLKAIQVDVFHSAGTLARREQWVHFFVVFRETYSTERHSILATGLWSISDHQWWILIVILQGHNGDGSIRLHFKVLQIILHLICLGQVKLWWLLLNGCTEPYLSRSVLGKELLLFVLHPQSQFLISRRLNLTHFESDPPDFDQIIRHYLIAHYATVLWLAILNDSPQFALWILLYVFFLVFYCRSMKDPITSYLWKVKFSCSR